MLRSLVLTGAFLLLLLHASAAEGKCPRDSLPCDDGACVRREDWCDSTKTCDDGSDEAYCKKKWWGLSQNECDPKIHFECGDGRCWPLVSRCDGIPDCRDQSDEEDCESEAKTLDETSEIKEDTEETNDKLNEDKPKEGSEGENEDKPKENSEDENEDKRKESSEEENENKGKESSEEENENKGKESSEEENGESKENSEENGGYKTSTIEVPARPVENDDYDEYDDPKEVPPQNTTTKDIPLPPNQKPPPSEEPSLEASPDAFFPPPTTEMDFYAKKMEQSEVRQQHSTQKNVRPTAVYRPSPVRPVTQYTTRPHRNQYTTSRRPAVPYTGPTRPYTPRPHRYVGARFSAQPPSPYRGRYQEHQAPYPQNGYRGSYRSPDSNYISSQPKANYRQQYRQPNGNNGREDWRNGVAAPPRVYGRQLRAPSRFYFKKNYYQLYGRASRSSVRRGVDWILSIRNATGGWGKETPRALVALSLVNNSFLAGNYENDLMQRYFQVHLAVKLLRDEPVSLNRLAMFVNALIATCQDPRDFQGWDLTELIRNTILKLHRAPRTPLINPLVYLSLCLADRNLTHYEVHHLMTYLAATRNDEATRDMRCLALEAFACHMQKEQHSATQYYSLQKMVWNATSRILQRRKEDGSFGSVYSTALALQALLSANETSEWDPEPTFRFLMGQQRGNGSFGDFLATYHVLPALSGRSLLHLRNTECNPPRLDRELSPEEILRHPGPKFYVHYSLHLGSPLSTAHTVRSLLPTGLSFFDAMRVAAHENQQFKFSYEEVNGKIHVYSISDLPNDPEEGLAWRLYVRSPSDDANTPNAHQLFTGDIRELLPTPDQHVIFWYHSLGF